MADRIERELDGIVDRVLAYKTPDGQKRKRRQGPASKAQKQMLAHKPKRNRRQRKPM